MNNTSTTNNTTPLKLILTALAYLPLIALLIAALHLKDPHLLPYRHLETPILLLITTTLIIYCHLKTHKTTRIAAQTLLTTTLTITLYSEISYQHHKSTALNNKLQNAHSLSPHFIVGYTHPEHLKPLIRNNLIAGVFITRRNIQGKTAQTLRQEIADLQAIRAQTGQPPLIIATDQEGGIVSRLTPLIPKQPPLASLITPNQPKPQLLSNAQAYGQQQGQALADLGITLNFSPVVDLKATATHNPLDFHSRINQRAISSDPILTTQIAQAYIQGLQSQNITATLKHFPGLARVTRDTHHFPATLNTPIAELQTHDWIPFQTIAQNTNTPIMLSHVTLAQIDPKNPASLSKPLVQNIIRNTWQHQGLLITDDLTMHAAYRHGTCYTTINALNAGVDLLLIAYDHEKIYHALYCANQAYQNGQLDKTILNQSQARLRNAFQ